MASSQRRYFQVALDAIEQFNRAENITTLSDHLVRAASSFGYQFLCCLSAPGIQKRAFEERVLLNVWPKGWFEQYQKSISMRMTPSRFDTRPKGNVHVGGCRDPTRR